MILYSEVPNKHAARFILFGDFSYLLTWPYGLGTARLLISDKPATYTITSFYVINIKKSHIHAHIKTCTVINFLGNLPPTRLFGPHAY